MMETREESTFVHSKTLGTIFWLNAYRSYGANYKAKGCLCLYPLLSPPLRVISQIEFGLQ